MNDGFCIGTQAYCVKSQLKMACCRLSDSGLGNVLHFFLSVGEKKRGNGRSRASRRGWSRWRSPAETLSINRPPSPPPSSFSLLLILFHLSSSLLFLLLLLLLLSSFSPYVSISHPRGKKSNKKYPSSHRRGGNIESFSRKGNEKLENVFNWNAFQTSFFPLFLSPIIPSFNSQCYKETSNWKVRIENLVEYYTVHVLPMLLGVI